MRGVVAQKIQSVGILGGDDGDLRVPVDPGRKVLHLAVYADGERSFGKAGTDAGRQLLAAHGLLEAAHVAVGQGDGNHEELL